MRAWWIGVAVVVLAALIAGCGGASDSNETPTATGSLASLAADVTKAVESGNSTRLLELQDLAAVPCAAAPAPGALLCPSGTTAGTAVPALIQDSGCKRNYAASEAAQRALWSELLAQSWTQYAVAKSDGQWGDIAGIEAVIIFEAKGSPELDLQVGITGKGIRAISRGCGGTPATDAAQFTDFLVPPPSR